MSKAKPETQRTQKGTEIPIPKRDDFFRDLEAVAGPPQPRKGQTKWSEIKRRKGVPPTD